MYTVRKLYGNEDFVHFVDIVADAYPGFKIETEEQKQKRVEAFSKIQEEDPVVSYYGVFKGEKIVGGMRYNDFNMNLLSTKVKAGGIGLVAVHQLHKKEKVAKCIVMDFIEYYREQGFSMALLYPFRPDFYKKMGFGFGTSMNQYKIKPSNLPKGRSKSNIVFLSKDDTERILNCYTRVYEKTNGLIEKYEKDFIAIFNNPKAKVAAYIDHNEVKGYIIYEFKQDDANFLSNDIIISQFLFENKEALMELMTFLNSQSDQIRYIIFNIQDEGFRFLLEDPTDGSNNLFTPVYHQCSIQGTGIMYRVINTKGIFTELKNHNFNNETCKLKITAKDTLIDENDSSIVVEFKDGFATLVHKEDYDVEISMDISDFSSLITCSVNFKTLYKYGRALISDEKYLNKVNNIFASSEEPICLTMF